MPARATVKKKTSSKKKIVSTTPEPPAKEEVDLSRYTIEPSGKAPIQEEDELNNEVEHNIAEEEVINPEVENAPKEPSLVKRRTIGFGLSPREKKVIDEDDVPFETKNRRLYFIGIIVSAFVLGATVATLYFRIREGSFTKEEIAVEVEEAASEETAKADTVAEPEATPMPRSEITLEILNGSGIAGQAGKYKNTFEDLGYTVDSVGNADDTVGNELYIDSDIDESLLSNLLEDVKSELDIESVTGTKDLDTAAQIVLGSKEE